MNKKLSRAKQVENLAKDGIILSVSLVLTPSLEVLTPRQHQLVRSINKRAALFLRQSGVKRGNARE